MKHNVLITGTSSGLGLHLSNKFELEGHQVVRHNGKKHCDLSLIDDINNLALEAKSKNVKILINNAAITCPNILFNNYKIDLINKMIDVNLRAPIILSHLLLNDLTDIININSMVGLETKRQRTLYSATKWGLRGFSNSLKAENSNINILDVYPTNIRTKPSIKNAMNIDMVVEKIYNSFIKKQKKLVLDGRKK